MFPNAACVVALIDRRVHHAEIIALKGESCDPPSDLQRGLELLIDPNWTPEQAIAVIEPLEDLRDRIWAHYELVPLEQYREDRLTQAELPFCDPPF